VNKLLGGQKTTMFPRYVPATDFGYIWEHLKTYAPIATEAENMLLKSEDKETLLLGKAPVGSFKSRRKFEMAIPCALELLIIFGVAECIKDNFRS